MKVIRKFRLILSSHQRHRIVQLFLLMIIGGFLETCSVSLILPFMNAVMDSEELMSKWYIQIICEVLHIESSRTLLIFLSIVLAVIYIFKNMYLMFEYNIQYRFVYGNMFIMQRRLLEAFIQRPYEYFLGISSGEVIRIISGDMSSAFNLLIVSLNMATEMIVSLMLICTIFIITPFVTACIAILLGMLLAIIFIFFKPFLRRAGINTQKSAKEMNKWLLQSIQGIKELKVMKKEAFFRDNYDKNGQVFVRAMKDSQILSAAPRFLIEGVCMGAMFVIIAVMISTGTELDTIIPMLTAVAMAAIRLLPSINRISSALSTVAYGEPMLDKVIENLRILEDNESRLSTFGFDGKSNGNEITYSETINFSNITYHYPGSDENILEGADMQIKKGDSVGIIGSSGSGKTTSVDILLGLLLPQSGAVFIDGIDIHEGLASWYDQIGYIPQMIFMLDDSIKANIAFGEREVDEEKVICALKNASLYDFVQALPDGLDTQIGERGVRLSGGQRQRIGIARALYKNPQVLILDEATSALDNETEADIMESINSLHGNKTIIIIAHRLTTIQACDHIYRVEGKKILKEK